MSGLIGSGVSNSNIKLRLLMLFAFGLAALGSVLYWRAHLLFAVEYVEFPTHKPASAQCLNDVDSSCEEGFKSENGFPL